MRSSRIVLPVLVAFLVSVGLAPLAYAVDDIPGKPAYLIHDNNVTVDPADPLADHAVLSVALGTGDGLEVWTSDDDGLLDLSLYPPGSSTLAASSPIADAYSSDSYGPSLGWFAKAPGTYYVDCFARGGATGVVSGTVWFEWQPYIEYVLGCPTTQIVDYGASGGLSATVCNGDGLALSTRPFRTDVLRRRVNGEWEWIASIRRDVADKFFAEPVKVKTF